MTCPDAPEALDHVRTRRRGRLPPYVSLAPLRRLYREGWEKHFESPSRRTVHSLYIVWPYGASSPDAICVGLTPATLFMKARTGTQGLSWILGSASVEVQSDVWIVRSDGVEVREECDAGDDHGDAIRVPSNPDAHVYLCNDCWAAQREDHPIPRLSQLQRAILCWVGEDAHRAQPGSPSSHAALVKAMLQTLGAPKANISTSLRNLAWKHLMRLQFSPGGKTIAVELTPTGHYRAKALLNEKL